MTEIILAFLIGYILGMWTIAWISQNLVKNEGSGNKVK